MKLYLSLPLYVVGSIASKNILKVVNEKMTLSYMSGNLLAFFMNFKASSSKMMKGAL